jgi:hypothetical protein
LIVVLPAIGACSKGKVGDDAPSASASTSAAGSAGNTASTNRLCSLYTTSEIQGILGASVGQGEAAGPMATACQWNGQGDGVYAQVQVIPGADNWEKHTGAKGYEVLPGIGKEAFVAMALGGWEAGTVTDKTVVFVSLNGGTASRNSAVDFLKQTMAKLGPGT